MSYQQDFINSLICGAQETQKQFGIFASVTIAQAIWETGWGKSSLVRTDNNLFGIKEKGNHGVTISRGTWATDDGGYYAHYNSLKDCMYDHGYFLKNNSRYPLHGVFTASDGYQQIERIMEAGYASNAYEDGAKSIMKQYNLTQYDNVQAIEITGSYNDLVAITKMHGDSIPVVRKGDRGDFVRWIQLRVGASVDGIFGQETETKVCEYQWRKGLVTDGIVGTKTWYEFQKDVGGF